MSFDAILVGGGLQNALVALAVLERNPAAKLLLLEQNHRLGGNHTWSFHAGDLSPFMAQVVEPLVSKRWPAYEVAFPGWQRRIKRPYASIFSAHLHQLLVERTQLHSGFVVRLSATVETVTSSSVALTGGEHLEAPLVVDARGPAVTGCGGAYQKFFGQEFELSQDSPFDVPMVMDADVPQRDGFRFLYLLPLGPRRVLLEDTYYSENPGIDGQLLAAGLLQLARLRGLQVVKVLRSELGVLPLPFTWTTSQNKTEASPIRGGYGGGWFHPTTGYSLPVAARLAEVIALHWPEPPTQLALHRLEQKHLHQVRWAMLLNRLLFGAFKSGERWKALAHFHRLPVSTLERFYALRSTALDRVRWFTGRPPGGIRYPQALSAVFNLKLRGSTQHA